MSWCQENRTGGGRGKRPDQDAEVGWLWPGGGEVQGSHSPAGRGQREAMTAQGPLSPEQTALSLQCRRAGQRTGAERTLSSPADGALRPQNLCRNQGHVSEGSELKEPEEVGVRGALIQTKVSRRQLAGCLSPRLSQSLFRLLKCMFPSSKADMEHSHPWHSLSPANPWGGLQGKQDRATCPAHQFSPPSEVPAAAVVSPVRGWWWAQGRKDGQERDFLEKSAG